MYKRTILIGVLCLLFGFIVATSIVSITNSNQKFTGSLDLEVDKIRIANGLAPLNQTKELDQVAKAKCDDMVARNYFGHEDPDGKRIWKSISVEEASGENIARGYFNAGDTVRGWVNSPTHFENLTRPQFKEVGYAICQNETNYLIVQEFKG